MMRLAAVLVASLSLAGCAGSVAERMIAPERAAAREDDYCQSIGAAYGSPNYQACRMQLNQNAEMRRAQAIEGMQRASASMTIVPPNPPANNTIHCTTMGPSTYRTTTCN